MWDLQSSHVSRHICVRMIFFTKFVLINMALQDCIFAADKKKKIVFCSNKRKDCNSIGNTNYILTK